VAADSNSEVQTIRTLQDALSAAEAQRDEALRELDDLARFLSHDLRAPLRGIDGYSKALVEDYAHLLDPLALSYLQFICDSGRLAANVLDRLIQYIRTPRAILNLQPVDLSWLAEDTLIKLKGLVEYSAQPRQVNWHITPGLVAQADERLVRLLLEVLLENAWKFTSKRTVAVITFSAHTAAGEAQDAETVYFIQDNGAGFNPEYSGRLFQPFQRLHSGHEFEGAGMGLAVARRIIARLGGRIWAQGEVDQGATLFFTFNNPLISKQNQGASDD